MLLQYDNVVSERYELHSDKYIWQKRVTVNYNMCFLHIILVKISLSSSVCMSS